MIIIIAIFFWRIINFAYTPMVILEIFKYKKMLDIGLIQKKDIFRKIGLIKNE